MFYSEHASITVQSQASQRNWEDNCYQVHMRDGRKWCKIRTKWNGQPVNGTQCQTKHVTPPSRCTPTTNPRCNRWFQLYSGNIAANNDVHKSRPNGELTLFNATRSLSETLFWHLVAKLTSQSLAFSTVRARSGRPATCPLSVCWNTRFHSTSRQETKNPYYVREAE